MFCQVSAIRDNSDGSLDSGNNPSGGDSRDTTEWPQPILSLPIYYSKCSF